MRGHPTIAAVAVAALSLVACTPADDVATTTSTTAAPRTPTPQDPLRVLFAGDSVMAGLVPPLQAAFDETGAASGRFVLTPSILRDPAARFTWRKQVEEVDPEVVVVLVGTWEAMIVEGDGAGAELEPGTEAWAAWYRTELVEPWLGALTESGAAVVWVGMPPPIGDGAVAQRIPALDAVFAAVAAERADMTYVAPMSLVDVDGAPLDVDADGRRLRQVDGLHLCPAGAAVLAADVLAVLTAEHALVPATAWADDDGWHDDVLEGGAPVYPVDACPADGPTGP